MARPNKKSVYERIENKKQEILNKERELADLKNELDALYKEQDQEEMLRMLEVIRSQGIDIETALSKLSSDNFKTNKK